jgi:hypothetical protein
LGARDSTTRYLITIQKPKKERKEKGRRKEGERRNKGEKRKEKARNRPSYAGNKSSYVFLYLPEI